MPASAVGRNFKNNPLKADETMELTYVPVAVNQKMPRKTDGYAYNYCTAQGFTSTDKYLVVTLRRCGSDTKYDDKNLLLLYDTSGKLIKVSKPIDLGHGNDLTWNGTYIVAANTLDGNKEIVLIDPNTLKVVKTVNAPKGGGGLAYDSERGYYYQSYDGGVRVLDSNFQLINGAESHYIDTNPWGNQGVSYNMGYVFRPQRVKTDDTTFTNSSNLNKDATVVLQFSPTGVFTKAYYSSTPKCEVENITFLDDVPYLLYSKCAGTTAESARAQATSEQPRYFAIYKITDEAILETMRQQYTITYDANGGTGAPAPQVAYIGTATKLSKEIPLAGDPEDPGPGL